MPDSINEPPGGSNNPYPITPRLDTISPSSTVAGSAPLTLTCTGRAFTAQSQISVNGVIVPTVFGASSSLTAANVTTKPTPGTWPVVVLTKTIAGWISTSPQTWTFT